MKKLVFGVFTGLVGVVCGAAVTNTVSTAAVGEVRVVAADPGAWRMSLEPREEAGVSIVKVSLVTDGAECVPPEFDATFSVSGAGARHVWTTDFSKYSPTLWPALWNNGRRYGSQLACEAPLLSAIGTDDRAKFTMAASETFDKVVMTMVVNERTCQIEGGFKFFSELSAPRKSYVVELRLDRRDHYWGAAVREASDWIGRAAGFTPATVPPAAYEPLYSTWYAYLQDVHASPLEEEAKRAAELGMKTMILDDGWQKEKSVSFYSAVGDWMPVKSRFPDMKAHVDAVHRAGLKYMLWLSVPYVGDETVAWTRFEDKMLVKRGETSPGRIGVLDPRFPEVRDYLIKTYERVVGEWGFDGVKLDFIDSFALSPDSPDPAVAENYAGRDYKSLPAAVDRLMKDVLAHLKAIRSDVLVEFRQHYMGPAIRQYGNMIRAADCPVDPAFNRRRICDLRLTSGETAVHSDMLVWSVDETPEGAAQSILSAIFGVIQYSMILKTLPASHRTMMRHWMGFARDHRETLLRGVCRPHHPEAGYPLVEAESDAERIIGAYADGTVVPLGAADRPVFVINATGASRLAVEAERAATVVVYDTFGRPVRETRVASGLTYLDVPPSGYARVGYAAAKKGNLQ